mmetsp:Transcript_4991/g.12036  ORF Transcript_4991/g.12036 Transcript_4991/m.12036 type:complete len:217 (-) Transcript_4991:465-1115(-)
MSNSRHGDQGVRLVSVELPQVLHVGVHPFHAAVALGEALAAFVEQRVVGVAAGCARSLLHEQQIADVRLPGHEDDVPGPEGVDGCCPGHPFHIGGHRPLEPVSVHVVGGVAGRGLRDCEGELIGQERRVDTEAAGAVRGEHGARGVQVDHRGRVGDEVLDSDLLVVVGGDVGEERVALDGLAASAVPSNHDLPQIGVQRRVSQGPDDLVEHPKARN